MALVNEMNVCEFVPLPLAARICGVSSFGLMMTINYAGVTTPYTMGMLSGNVPE